MEAHKDSFTKFKNLLKKSHRIVIVTHWSPDGDAMGSSLGLYNYLVKTGKEVHVVVPNDYPEFLQWLPGNKKVLDFQQKEKKAASLIANADLIFTLDFNTFKRLEKLGELIEAAEAPKILVDHHQQPDNYATLRYHDVQAGSTCELVYELIVGLGGAELIDAQIASCLYTGLMTDTGSFRYPSVNANTHRIVADLIEYGAKPSEIHSAVYDTYSKDRMQLLGYCLTNKMTVLEEYHTAYITLSAEEMERFHYQKGDTEGVVNYPFAIKGIRFCVFFSEGDDKVKASFRSKGKFDVNKFARMHFSGGGHVNAAGGKSDRSLENTVKFFLSLLPQYQKDLNKK